MQNALQCGILKLTDKRIPTKTGQLYVSSLYLSSRPVKGRFLSANFFSKGNRRDEDTTFKKSYHTD